MPSTEPGDRQLATKRGNGEGSIYYQKSKERWAASLSMPGGKRKMLYGRTRQEATAPQIGWLLVAMQGHRYEPLWRILLATGLRFGEAAALRWEDVDLEERTVAVRRSLTRIPGGYSFTQPKTARGRRIIPLPAAAAETLRTHQEHQEL